MLPTGTVTTWQEFQSAFRARYLPQGLKDQKKKEFRKLTQGEMTVDEYQRKFLELSRYAEDDVCTDARKQEKFREGLHPDIQLALVAHDCADFATLVSQAFRVETGLAGHRESLKRTHDVGSSSNQPIQKWRVWIPHNVWHRPAPTLRLSYVAPRMPSPPRPLTVQGEQPNDMDSPQVAPRPPDGRKKSCRNRRLRSCSARPSAIVRGQVTHVNMEEARESPKIVMGTLPVNSVAASVLFDSGASHSFVSQHFAQLHGLAMSSLPTPLAISTPRSRWQTQMISLHNQIRIEGLMFPVSLIALGPSDIDVILGMDWLEAHNATINCAARSVQLTHPSGQRINYSARIIQNAESQM